MAQKESNGTKPASQSLTQQTQQDLPTHTTIYIKNLNDHINLQRLKTTLHEQCSHFGKVLQVTAHHNLKLRGQAFVTFSTPQATLKALDQLQGRRLYHKNIQVSLARKPSDSYFREVSGEFGQVKQRKREKRTRLETESKDERKPDKKETGESNQVQTSVAKRDGSEVNVNYWKSLPPNNILLIQNLQLVKEGDTEEERDMGEELEEFFEQFNGFNKIRLIKVRKLAFIEFDTEAMSTNCLQIIKPDQIKQMFGESVVLSYAKK